MFFAREEACACPSRWARETGERSVIWNVKMGCIPKDLVQAHSSGNSSLGAGIVYLFKSSIWNPLVFTEIAVFRSLLSPWSCFPEAFPDWRLIFFYLVSSFSQLYVQALIPITFPCGRGNGKDISSLIGLEDAVVTCFRHISTRTAHTD